MEHKVFTPYIHIGKDDVQIIGDSSGLSALGEALMLKAKLGSSGSITFSDDINKPIKIISSDDLDAKPTPPSPPEPPPSRKIREGFL